MSEEQIADRLRYLYENNTKFYFMGVVSEELKIPAHLAGAIYEVFKLLKHPKRNGVEL